MHRIQSLVSLSLLSSSILAVSACGDLADKDYPGEPLVTLHGTVTNPQALTVGDEALKAFLIWLPDTDDGVVIADEVAIDSNLPADFTFQVLEEPPASVRGEYGAMAVILIMTDAQKDEAVAQINSRTEMDVGVVGLAQGVLYYLETAEQAASFPSDVNFNPAVVGFNMTGIHRTCGDDPADCSEGTVRVPLDSAIPVKLVDTDTMTGLSIGSE